eukprot:TRINITY_DN2403_c0_g3_i2.p2 TRINITY_DN2403_c0_g3~~TRINITY_DN2403_c0_g3_i2.p2  ORF type:complete len:323 (-),score=109.65 TRINITY_DN2403_c0_g3_i2:1174-2106(-)
MASEKVGPSHLFPLIQQFLQINNLTKTLKCFVKETNTEENKLKAPEEDLIQIYKIYLENRPKKRKVPDSPEENQKKKTPKKETPKKETEKKEDSEDSDSDSDSESESEEESKEDQKKKKGKEAQKKEDKGKDKEKVKEKENGKKDKKEEEKKGKEKEKEKEEKGKKKEKETKGKKTKDSDSESSDSSESESESDSGSESEASAKKTPKNKRQSPLLLPQQKLKVLPQHQQLQKHQAKTSEDYQLNASNESRPRKSLLSNQNCKTILFRPRESLGVPRPMLYCRQCTERALDTKRPRRKEGPTKGGLSAPL